MNPHLEQLATAVDARLAGKVRRVESNPHELTYVVAAADLLEVCRILRDEPELKFEMLMDLCGVDYLHYGRDEWRAMEATRTGFSRGAAREVTGMQPKDAPEVFDRLALPPESRFAVVYHLLSITHNWRLRLRVFCPDDERPMVDSVTGIWNSANWYEREAFDLFGILFRGHEDLRRILTDYGFVGHPFRKDFPLIGQVEMRYDPEKQRVVYQPVSIEPRTLVPKVIRRDNRYAPQLKERGNG